MKRAEILLVDDEDELRRSTAQSLDLAGFAVRDFANAERALDFVTQGFNGVVITDIRMPGMDGMTLMSRVREIDGDIPVILATGHGDVQLAVKAMREGAYDFIEKPFNGQALADIAARAMDRRRLVLENRRLRAVAGKRDDIESRLPGRTQAMIDLRYRLRAVAPTDADVLIIGDTGSGKEVAARALHDISGRATKPFVAINCAALPGNLIESELFGHEAGAFPGAMRARYGKFEHARGGTVLLDEIGSMPLDLQARLLRVIQERVITRLGSNEAVPLDVRFIATSKADLEPEVAVGRFRADLLYRLNVVTLRLPALAARREDVPLLFLQLVNEAAARYRRDDIEVPPQVVADIARRDWPGNVRELRNAADRFVLGLGLSPAEDGGDDDARGVRLAVRVAEFERGVIAGALAASGGSLKPVYESLGISRKTLYEKMQKYGLEKGESATD
ncbi:two-component system, NtrC family, C4-dicarboxylate transport response regulator DctD [Mesorhizobium albiziae]|uniref:Two-component system, NtrC family, C4-dicarboxylate transport response regulator DctD n=1 Tax=Neomesorhizobium albiziae TaxID=335020 RepID=A0A1I4C9A5_9HYPH|nr:sigma-54 dependent transcriptional regulator [Mesorhizobium albiziae]GLS29451.1 Fis family transcriptional regulator [Mesorhizobium albiziae]SFK76756.1 two-component system, NtrC family, C4-dicarboxylate transport response regulator DctD [Mesorhizobium albiziae]